MAEKMTGNKGGVKIKGYAAGASATSLVTLCIKKWEASLKKSEFDTSSTCNTDWTEVQYGKKTVEFTIDADLVLANDPLGASGVDLQADYAAVQLYTDIVSGTPTPYFDIPKAGISDVKITNMENGIISYTITGKSSGTVGINALVGS